MACLTWLLLQRHQRWVSTRTIFSQQILTNSQYSIFISSLEFHCYWFIIHLFFSQRLDNACFNKMPSSEERRALKCPIRDSESLYHDDSRENLQTNRELIFQMILILSFLDHSTLSYSGVLQVNYFVQGPAWRLGALSMFAEGMTSSKMEKKSGDGLI